MGMLHTKKRHHHQCQHILLAPAIVAEYIVVHELAHLRFRHHQKIFWDEVGRLMPGYRDAEKILKTEGWKFVF